MTKGDKKSADVKAVEVKIASYGDNYRQTTEQIHRVIMTTQPDLCPRLWYGMPGYALKPSGPVILFFRPDKYISFGITESANITNLGNIATAPVASSWYITEFNAEAEQLIQSVVEAVAR